MRYLRPLAFTLIIGAAIGSLTACKKSAANLGDPPTITLLNGGEYTGVNTTVDTSTVIRFGVQVSKGGSIDDMSKLYVKYAVDASTDTTTLLDVSIPDSLKSSTFTLSRQYKVRPVAGTETLLFIVTNTHGLENRQKFTLTVKE